MSGAPALRLRGLGLRVGGRVLLAGVDLTIDAGERVALLGASGSGKSTLGLAVAGLADGVEVSGEIWLAGHRLPDDEAGRRRLRGGSVGVVFQEPLDALDPLWRVGALVAETQRVHGRPVDPAAAFAEVGLSPALLERRPHELSGGQRQRVAVAAALAAGPALLVADEATSALDSVAQAELLALFAELPARRGLGLLLVTHDPAVAATADRCVVVHEGRLVPGVAPTPAHPRRGPGDPGAVVLDAEVEVDVPTGWFGRRRLLAPTPVQVRRGETVAIVGTSGSGKSTLARALCRLGPVRGHVRIDGVDLLGLHGAPLRAARRRIQLVPQDPGSTLDPLPTVGATLLEAGGRPDELLARVGLDPAVAARRPPTLSGGEKQRVALARALATRPDVLVLDEAVSALDPELRVRLLGLVDGLRTQGLGVVLVSHDLGLVRGFADRILVMDEGRVVEELPRGATPASAPGVRLFAASPG